jgi:hypothetical protein
MLPPTADSAAPRRAAQRRWPPSSRRHASAPNSFQAAVPVLPSASSPSPSPAEHPQQPSWISFLHSAVQFS